MSEINQQIISLEEKVAYQEQAIEVLSERLYKQQKEMAQLKKKLDDLLNFLSSDKSSEDKMTGELVDIQEVPPHY